MAAADSCELLCIDLDAAERVRHALPDPATVARTADRARALAEPTRLRVLLALQAEEELCGCDLAWILGMSQALVSHHLRALRGTRLVASRRDARMVFHSLTPEGRALLAAIADAEVIA
jgi:ArsR family transcriptional regulator, lead/cadmium/zinc/bismuth-responsive transcriptional repressor